MIEWTKLPSTERFMQPTYTAYILPCDKGIQILYDCEQCVIENIDVQEFVEALKPLATDPPSFKADFKSTVELAVNHLILPQKPATT